MIGAIKRLGLAVVFGLAAWMLYRVFRFRRNIKAPIQVEETRESLLTWSRANRDLSNLLFGWWKSISPSSSFRKGQNDRTSQCQGFLLPVLGGVGKIGTAPLGMGNAQIAPERNEVVVAPDSREQHR